MGCQGYPEPRVGLGFRTQFGTCWTQQSTQMGLLRAKTALDSEMVPPFLQNTLYLETLSALKFPLAGLGLRAGWDAGHTGIQDAPRWRLRLRELLAPHIPKSCQARGRGIQKSMFNIITGLRFGSASWPVTLPSPSSPLWEHSQDGQAGGESQHEHFGQSLQVLWLRAAKCPPAHLGWAPSPPPPPAQPGMLLCTEFTKASQEQRARTPISATAAAFTSKGPKMLI